MKIEIIGSTKAKHVITKEEAVIFSGHAAGMCYMPDTAEALFNEPVEKTIKRAENTLKSGHHSVYDHVTYNLVLNDIPKILAVILNNEGVYTTSEKSGRYTKMRASEEEENIYNKWIEIFTNLILEEYPTMPERRVRTLARENARCLISSFTPATTMQYSVSLRQINYIISFLKNYINDEPDTDFNKKLKPVMQEFIDQLKDVTIDGLNADEKKRKLSLFADRDYKDEFGECYSANYKTSLVSFAQAQRHRTIRYKIKLLDDMEFYIPKILDGHEKEKKQWIEDISSRKEFFPQGMLVQVNERGTVEDFILKCYERFCGAAQLEIALQTKETFDRYLEATKNTNSEVYDYLKQYDVGARCMFKDFHCQSPCFFGPKGAFTRKI